MHSFTKNYPDSTIYKYDYIPIQQVLEECTYIQFCRKIHTKKKNTKREKKEKKKKKKAYSAKKQKMYMEELNKQIKISNKKESKTTVRYRDEQHPS